MLRDYQAKLTADIWRALDQPGVQAVCAVMPTGAGKTVTFAHMTDAYEGAVALMVHRVELVAQISLALARVGAVHRIIAPPSTISACLAEHRRELGRTVYNPHSEHSVIAVDTLVARGDIYAPYAQQVGLWIIDEAAHVLADNKWGKCAAMFPNAKGVGFTATPKRADGKGLGRHAHGVFDDMVIGPTVAELIARGFLSKYRILSTPSDMNLDDLKATASGDFAPKALATRAHASHIVGDVVETYLKHAAGKQGITFTTDVETANHMAERFNQAGVPAKAVSAKTPDAERAAAIRAFRKGELKQLTNCDLFGEGFDVPGVEAVSLARPTCSLALYLQQVGRAMRPAEGKSHALILDHVGNWQRHGLPDTPRRWNLDARERASKGDKDPDVMAVTSCLECFGVFPRAKLPTCPYCGARRDPTERRRPEQVDGDLMELDPDVLAALREAVELPTPDRQADKVFHKTGNKAAAEAARGHAYRRIEAQQRLRDAEALWGGHGNAQGKSDSELYREFFLTFGVDVLTAQTWGTKEMDELTERILKAIEP